MGPKLHAGAPTSTGISAIAHRLMSMGALACLVACTGSAVKPQSELRLRCEFVRCECRDPVHPFSPAAPVLWNDDGSAGCAEGRVLVTMKEGSPTGGKLLPTYSACAHSGPRDFADSARLRRFHH